ncbi:pyridoxamine 5'-phosphate oxidase family protein [Jiangella mangrovi]|uniref:PPOX class probable F420-dependent enzyme n=1 Tax=Jiangella mangrovi TaxID=1524084 RepID=A0A7W9LP64_9ACTN|nr:pyridoxamine 5'-phosphate oxidase family protein [Jiangella mangrovi]MBB5790991.1 PPOX class probable F420-dependent enzyme [Jiangella mangrovi]
MPKPPLPDDISAFLAQPNPAVMGTIGPSGPVTVATWYFWEDGRILINLDESRKRVEHLRADPRVSLTALAEDWYTHVSVQGRVVDLFDDEGLADIDRLSRHYTGHEYGRRDRGRISAWIEVDRWHGWGKFAGR